MSSDYNSVTRALAGREKKTESVELPVSEKTVEAISRDYNSVTRGLEGREKRMELSHIEARLKKVIRDYNRRAKSQNYRTWRFEEVLDLLTHEKATICKFCGMLILAGKHKNYSSNFERHLRFNANCLRIRGEPNRVEFKKIDVAREPILQSALRGELSTGELLSQIRIALDWIPSHYSTDNLPALERELSALASENSSAAYVLALLTLLKSNKAVSPAKRDDLTLV